MNSSEPLAKGVVTLDDNGTVVDVGVLDDECESTEFYNGILVPGFVNSHSHLELSHLKGAFTKGSGMAGFIRQINLLRNSVDLQGRAEAFAREMEQLYNSGVSAVADISNCDETFNYKSESPLYTRTFLEVFGSEPSDADEIVRGVKELSKKADEIGIDAAPTPHSCYTMSPRLLEMICREALSGGWLSYHNQESWEEEELIKNGSGPLHHEYKRRGLSTPPITGEPALLYFLGMLDKVGGAKESKVLLVHNTFTDEYSAESAIERVKNLFWAVCPLSNLFIHNSLPPLELLRKKGAVITVGTDSLSSNDILSMAEEIKCIDKYFPSIPLGEILQWCTINGARFLGVEDKFGSFEPGKKPGVVLIENVDLVNLKLREISTTRRLM